MKNNTLKAAAAVGLSALLMGSAAAQSSVSQPVGYETITVPNGFSYAGLRLHEAPIASGEATTVAGAAVTVADGIADSLVADTTYLFEVVSGNAAGAVVVVDSFDAASDTLTLGDDISGDFVDGDSFVVRPAATLASIFGAANEAGLDAGSGGTAGADQIFLVNESGGFDRFYFDTFNLNSFNPEWTNAETGLGVDPTAIDLVYTDGLIILGAGTADNTFVISGSVKLTDSSYALTSGFNYISTASPAGATLATMFDPIAESGLIAGNGGSAGADQVLVPNAAGGFDNYYFDTFNITNFVPTWTNPADNSPVDPTTISFESVSSVIILNPGAAKQISAAVPSFFSDL